MFYSTLLIAASAFTSLVSAQNTSASYSTSGALEINPDTVTSTIRENWCLAETNSCPQLCGGSANPNSCDPDTLTYTCTCTNGNSPNISNYAETLPSLICGQWRVNCVAAHPNDAVGQAGCQSVVCGTANASDAESSAASSSVSSTSASATSTGAVASASSKATSATSAASSAASSAAASATAKSAAMAIDVAKNYGTGILAAGMLGLFGLVL